MKTPLVVVVTLGINPTDVDFHGGGGQYGFRGPRLFLKLWVYLQNLNLVCIINYACTGTLRFIKFLLFSSKSPYLNISKSYK